MPRLTELEVKEWQEQLDFSNREWQRFGLLETTDQAVDGERTASMREFIQAYRGTHVVENDMGLNRNEHFTGNLTFSTINVLQSILSGRSPEVELRPKGDTLSQDDALRRARLNEVLIQSQIREMKYKREVDLALLSGLISRFGCVQHGYTPSIDEFADDKGTVFTRFKNHLPDFPWIQFKRPWEVRFDPLAQMFDPDAEVGWCAFYSRIRESEKQKSKRWIDRKDWTATWSQEQDDNQHRSHQTEQSPEAGKLYEVWEIYDAAERKVFALSPGSDKEVMEPRDWPIEWGQLPYSLLTFNRQIDTPMGIAFPEMFRDEQHLYNKVWTILSSTIARTMRRIAVNKQALDAEQTAILMNPEALMEFILLDGDLDNAFKEINFSSIDQSLLPMIGLLQTSIRETLGVSQFDRGQRINVETAQEAGQVGAGADVQRSRNQGPFEDFWAEIAKVSHRAMIQTEDPRKFIIPIIGEQSSTFLKQDETQQGFVEASVEDLKGEFDYAVKVGSTLALDPSELLRRQSIVLQTLQPLQTLDVFQVSKDMVDAADLNARWVLPKQVQEDSAAIQDEQGLGGEGGGNGSAPAGPDLRSLQAASSRGQGGGQQ